jgi:hypothetical protein
MVGQRQPDLAAQAQDIGEVRRHHKNWAKRSLKGVFKKNFFLG